MHYTLETTGTVKIIHHAPKSSSPAAAEQQQLCANGPSPNCTSDPGRPSHQLFLLRLFLECFNYPSLLLLGDGVRLAPDALSYFAGVQWLLTSDPSLWCLSGGSNVSASLARGRGSSSVLLRSDQVGDYGSGWLVTKGVGRQLLAQWREAVKSGGSLAVTGDSSAGWWRYLRSRAVRRNRQCIFPEMPRVWCCGVGVQGALGADASNTGTSSSSSGAGSVKSGKSGGSNAGRSISISSSGGGNGGGSDSSTSGSSSFKPSAKGGGPGNVLGDAHVRRLSTASESSLRKAKSSSSIKRRRLDVAWTETDVSWLMEPHYSRLVIEVVGVL